MVLIDLSLAIYLKLKEVCCCIRQDCLDSANDDVVEVFAQVLKLNLLQGVKVGEDFHPDSVRHAYASAAPLISCHCDHWLLVSLNLYGTLIDHSLFF